MSDIETQNSTKHREGKSELNAFVMSASQGAAGGALRCAIECIMEAQRQLECHYLNNRKMMRPEYIQIQTEINDLRIAACDAMKPLWKYIET